jgi:hypothetical protein
LSKPIAWSYSRITSYEQCPKKFWHLSVAKDFKEPESEQMRYGNRVHKALEKRITNGTPLPTDLGYIEPVVAKFANATGEKFAEQQLAINQEFQPTGWFSSDTWGRAIIDLAIVNGERALLVDWKTGKMSDDFTQQRMAACLFFIFHPQVQVIDLMYYWIADKKPTTESLKREDAKHIWSAFLRRVRKYTAAHEQTEFPPRPSGLCKKHCPVTSCPHHGGK